MSNIKSLDRLREKIQLDVNNPWSDLQGELLAMCDKVEREVSERFCELPCDEDSVLIHVGDMVQGLGNSGPVQHLELWDDAWVVVFEFAPGQFTRYSGDAVRHVKPRTVEDVLTDFAPRWMDAFNPERKAVLVKEYADELRKMGVGE